MAHDRPAGAVGARDERRRAHGERSARGSLRASSHPGRKRHTPAIINFNIAVMLLEPKKAVAATSVTRSPVTWSRRPSA